MFVDSLLKIHLYSTLQGVPTQIVIFHFAPAFRNMQASFGSKRKCDKNQYNIEFLIIHPTLRGHFGARVDGNIKLSNFFDEMRLKRSLRPPRLLRL
jgi:hypothetical protein